MWLEGAVSRIGKGVDAGQAWLTASCRIVGSGFAERVVERALKIQIGFLIFLALAAPFGGMELGIELVPLLLAQAALTRLALIRVRRRDPIFGGALYLALAVVTYFEAKSYSGLVGAIFALEAVLSLVASFYIYRLLRRARRGEGQADPGRTPAELSGDEVPAQ
ncbi:MAG: hypothetical protein AAF416_09900 [Pseudomonadota bacterium]